MIATEKLYYKDSYLGICNAKVVDIKENKIILDKTVAFPEGGGQIGDIGRLVIENKVIPFYDTKKGVGRILNLPDFPNIQVDTPIYHFVKPKYLELVSIGDDVRVEIDIEHRILTTVLHSALHLVLMAARERRPDITYMIKGCKISTDSARIDFFAKDKFVSEDIEWINWKVTEMIKNEIPIYVYPHEAENEAWYWKCFDFICPCGGTHLTNTKYVGNVLVRRKNVGKTTERLVVNVEHVKLDIMAYHGITGDKSC